jgi:hypothetical protein
VVEVPDLVDTFVAPLQELGIEYMVTGGVAAVVYGDPRFTRDIDIVLKLTPADTRRFAFAFDTKRFYVPPADALRREAGRRGGGHFNVIERETTLRADIYLAGTDALHAWAFERRRALDLDGITLQVAPPEYVILRKLQYYRDSGSDRHLRDIAMMLRISREHIDTDEIEGWVSRLGLGGEWTAAREYAPEP